MLILFNFSVSFIIIIIIIIEIVFTWYFSWVDFHNKWKSFWVLNANTMTHWGSLHKGVMAYVGQHHCLLLSAWKRRVCALGEWLKQETRNPWNIHPWMSTSTIRVFGPSQFPFLLSKCFLFNFIIYYNIDTHCICSLNCSLCIVVGWW